MRRLSIAEALREAIRQEMRRDARVFCIGEDIGVCGGWGGAFTVTLGLEQEFPERMVNTPISENGFFGVALGAALMGLRPIVDVQYADFILLAMDQVVNQIAKMRYMSGGKLTRAAGDAGPGGRDRPRGPTCPKPRAVPAAGAGNQDRGARHRLRRRRALADRGPLG